MWAVRLEWVRIDDVEGCVVEIGGSCVCFREESGGFPGWFGLYMLDTSVSV